MAKPPNKEPMVSLRRRGIGKKSMMCNRPTSVQLGSVDSNCPLSPEDLLPNALAFSCWLRERSPRSPSAATACWAAHVIGYLRDQPFRLGCQSSSESERGSAPSTSRSTRVPTLVTIVTDVRPVERQQVTLWTRAPWTGQCSQ